MSKVGEHFRELKKLQRDMNPIDIKPEKWDKYIPEIVEKSNKFGTPVSDLIKAKKEEIAIEQNNS